MLRLPISRTFLHRLLPVLPLALLVVSPGCNGSPIASAPDFREIGGVWDYTATEVTSGAVRCEVHGMSMTLVKVPNAGPFTGETMGGRMTCDDSGDAFSVDLDAFPISAGYTFNEFISFDVYNSDWRHSGVLSEKGDRMSGTFTLKNGVIEYDGKFSATKRVNP